MKNKSRSDDLKKIQFTNSDMIVGFSPNLFSSGHLIIFLKLAHKYYRD